MTDDQIITAIVRAWRSIDPHDERAMAAEALRIMRNATEPPPLGGESLLRQVGWHNPRTGRLYVMRESGETLADWQPVYAKST